MLDSQPAPMQAAYPLLGFPFRQVSSGAMPLPVGIFLLLLVFTGVAAYFMYANQCLKPRVSLFAWYMRVFNRHEMTLLDSLPVSPHPLNPS